jgi:ribosomal protein S27AE
VPRVEASPWPFDPTVTWVRHCARCGHIDASEWWPTREEAERALDGSPAWRCERCSSTEFAVKLAAKTAGG